LRAGNCTPCRYLPTWAGKRFLKKSTVRRLLLLLVVRRGDGTAHSARGSVWCSVAERSVESRGGLVKLNDWIDETVELQFVRREENGEPQKISGNLGSVGDRGVMLSYDETPRGRLFFYPWHTIERVEKVRA
jgi:hypothetical protein